MHIKVNGTRLSTEVCRRGCGETGHPDTFEKNKIVHYLCYLMHCFGQWHIKFKIP